jgi:hypothetical protein
LNGIAAISLVLCVATLVMLARSFWCSDNFTWAKKTYQTLNDGTDDIPRSVLAIDVSNEVGRVTVVYHASRIDRGPVMDYIDAYQDGLTYWKDQPIPYSPHPRPIPGMPVGQWAHWEFGHLAYTSFTDPGARSIYWSVPWQYFTALTALSPAAFIINFVKRRNAMREGRCARCGYDLRATPDRCPECGKAVEKAIQFQTAPAPAGESNCIEQMTNDQ